MIHSVTLPETTTAVKKSDDFKNRKRRSDDAREYTCGQLCNEEALARTCRCVDELGTIDEKELIHCKSILRPNHHHKKQRQSNAAGKHIGSM